MCQPNGAYVDAPDDQRSGGELGDEERIGGERVGGERVGYVLDRSAAIPRRADTDP